MAEVAGPSREISPVNSPKMNEEPDDVDEPKQKKQKLSSPKAYNLQERLNGVLCCTVCLDLPNMAVHQCTNGHLMCASCFAHLLADARLKDETATCPNCRCEISKNLCSRNLAVEKAISEMPAECRFCAAQHPRAALELHEREQCSDREVACKYARICCSWRGPFRALEEHENACAQQHKTGSDLHEELANHDKTVEESISRFGDIFGLLNYEKITFSDLQFRPYRTDDFITKLFYETSRFMAFNLQWSMKARINDSGKNPERSARRVITYQLSLKGKTQHPLAVRYLALRGPYGEVNIKPNIYEHEFTNESTDAPYQEIEIENEADCNKLLAQKAISLRLILFQIPKP